MSQRGAYEWAPRPKHRECVEVSSITHCVMKKVASLDVILCRVFISYTFSSYEEIFFCNKCEVFPWFAWRLPSCRGLDCSQLGGANSPRLIKCGVTDRESRVSATLPSNILSCGIGFWKNVTKKSASLFLRISVATTPQTVTSLSFCTRRERRLPGALFENISEIKARIRLRNAKLHGFCPCLLPCGYVCGGC